METDSNNGSSVEIPLRSFIFDNVWRKDLPDIEDAVVDLWTTHKLLPTREAAVARARELVVVVKQPDLSVVAVSTAYRSQIKHMNNNFFYYFRCMILPGHRRPGLFSRLLVDTCNILERQYTEDVTPHCIGIIMELQFEPLKKYLRSAVWKEMDMVYIGNTAGGNPVWTHYFEGAKI